MSTENLIAQLVAAQRAGVKSVNGAAYAELDRTGAYEVQRGVMAALGEEPGLVKVGIAADGAGIVAPIYASRVGLSGSLTLPLGSIVGIEVEVAAVLGSDLSADTARQDEIDIVEAVDHYIVGIEVCGTRFVDRKLAGANGQLADGLACYGYVIDPAPREAGAEVENYDIVIEHNGTVIYSAPAKLPFDTPLSSLVAYAKAQQPAYPLKKGGIATLGSLCGMVPVPGPGTITARFGNHVLTVDFV